MAHCLRGVVLLLYDCCSRKSQMSVKLHAACGLTAACLRLQSSLGAEVDITRIGLWGTSLAGGHALVTAAKEGTNVTAVVSQVDSLPSY